MRLRILYHGSCFDGCSSAGLFARFYRERIAAGAVEVAYRPLEHKGEPDPFPPGCFDGDENACVDFRYSQDPRLGWWFDHHVSAFQCPGDAEHFRADVSGRKFHDPTASSCAAFLARTLAEKFGFDTRPVAELIGWAEIIDGALFPDAKTAVELKEPALQLMTWIENTRDHDATDRFIEDLVSRPLGEIVARPYVMKTLAPLLDKHRRNVDTIRKLARLEGEVVHFDITEQPIGTFNKFIAYYLFPEARYLVGLTVSKRAKVSVGSNPWAKQPRTHDIAKICEKYGGGGHPAVGAVSLPKEDLARARKVQREIVAAL